MKSPLRKTREMAGLSQADVARALNLHQSTLHRIETDPDYLVRKDDAERIARFFGGRLTEMHILYPARFPDYEPGDKKRLRALGAHVIVASQK